ncbi:MAG: NAD(P)-binding protein [Xanthomonadales bacterium]|nr:NAD(P)-binding protein [Xanthomonadales bacterium]
MTQADIRVADIRSGRLSEAEIEVNFADMHAPLDRSEALVEADRCYFCFDAPCTIACPTDIDIPGFIQKIRSDNVKGSAQTILRENIMGGMCSRVCPTEVLCEEVCVRNTLEDKPVRIGLLQRYATDSVIQDNFQVFQRLPESGKHVAVVGGGPASLSCAHRLATLGHQVTVLDSAEKPGGLNEYGIAAYKTINNFAQTEVAYILGIGGIEVRNRVALGSDFSLASLREVYDAVFLGIGMGGVNELGLDNDQADGIVDAVEYISSLRQAGNKAELPVGRKVLVIGGGMTAIDVAVQSKQLGAEDVTIVYRRGSEQMGASEFEQDFAQTSGVRIRQWLAPVSLLMNEDRVSGIQFEYTSLNESGSLEATGEFIEMDADVVFKAIGQKVLWNSLGDTGESIELEDGRISVNKHRKTSLADVWAGGDCIVGGEDLTVSAVQDGKLAAMDINRFFEQTGE